MENIRDYVKMIRNEFDYDLVTVTDAHGIVLARAHLKDYMILRQVRTCIL